MRNFSEGHESDAINDTSENRAADGEARRAEEAERGRGGMRACVERQALRRESSERKSCQSVPSLADAEFLEGSQISSDTSTFRFRP